MKKIILIGAIALLAACGSSDKDVAVGEATDGTSASADSAPSDNSTADSIAGSDDTITVEDFGDMPPKCIELLGTFLKQIEPTVSEIDWDTATLGDFEAFSTQFQTESDSFDAESAAAGCDKYNLSGSDEKQFEQMAALAAEKAPGTLGFIKFLASLSDTQSASAGSLPADCASTIAAIEPYLANGTMKDLTVSEVGVFGQLMGAVNTKCSADEATAFFARDDVTAFVGE
jgi:hypothetical protein